MLQKHETSREVSCFCFVGVGQLPSLRSVPRYPGRCLLLSLLLLVPAARFALKGFAFCVKRRPISLVSDDQVVGQTHQNFYIANSA